MNLYFDSSVILAVMLNEPTASHARLLLAEPAARWISRLTLTECERTLRRDGLDPGLLGRSFAHFGLIGVTDAVWARAGGAFQGPNHLRTLDALHLAIVLELASRVPNTRMVSFDQRLCEHARAEGLVVVSV